MTTIYTINNKVLKKDSKWLIQDPYNPLGLPPSTHTQTFTNCGLNTTTGAAELAQIPSDWK